MIAAPAPCAKGVAQDGLADLGFELRDGRTRLTKLSTRSPLAVQRVLYPDERRPHTAHVIVANPTAGLLAGDRHVVNARVASRASAVLTTQAATKVFSMPQGAAAQTLSMTVANDASLEYLPRALIPFRDSSLSQRIGIVVAPGGTAVFGEVFGLGRVLSGERLAFRLLALDMSVGRPDGSYLYLESMRLELGQRGLDMVGVIPPTAGALGTLVVVTDCLTPDEMCSRVRARTDRNDGQCGVAPLPGGGGIVVKLLARSATQAESLISAARDALDL